MPFYKSSSFTKLVLFISRLLQKHYRSLQRSFTNGHTTCSHLKIQSQSSLSKLTIDDQSSQKTTLIFNVEGTLLKSPSLFPYFMLVAFEAGSLIRAFLLLFLYPFICLFSDELSLNIMVMICFFGIKKEGFRVGSSVLPKFFLEDVGVEGFEVLRKAQVKVGVTGMPQVMVESFLRDYLEVDYVIGRELKVVCGYYFGLMEDKKDIIEDRLEEIFEDEKISDAIIGLDNINKSAMDKPCFSRCKEIYMVNEAEKVRWNILERQHYPKPLIFHDGRLAMRPTPLAMLSIFIWLPMGLALSITRAIILSLPFPYSISSPLLAFTGMRLKVLINPNLHSNQNNNNDRIKSKGILYVCNHRTLLDPLFLSFSLHKSISAVTYSLSRLSEILAPIRTVRLSRDRDVDRKMMDQMLNQGDLVICPEGTTCREPYLLRLSPLFTELSDDIVPVGMDCHVDMFYGTTASGLKCFDPFYFAMNPCPGYTVRFLDRVCSAMRCDGGGDGSRFEVANYVQRELGKALGFECTMITRRDKYMILAGNEGVVVSADNNNNNNKRQ